MGQNERYRTAVSVSGQRNERESMMKPMVLCGANSYEQKVTVQDTHYPKMKSGFPEIAFLIAS